MTRAKVGGWAMPDNERVSHFFTAGESLCRRWRYVGVTTPEPLPTGDNCRVCAQKVAGL